jgi:hypothetical protein
MKSQDEHKTFANYMNHHGSAGLGFAYVDTEDDCSTVYPPAGLEPATLNEFLVRYRALLSQFQPEAYLVLTQVTDTDFDLGEIVPKDNVQVSRKWYDLGPDPRNNNSRFLCLETKASRGLPDLGALSERSVCDRTFPHASWPPHPRTIICPRKFVRILCGNIERSSITIGIALNLPQRKGLPGAMFCARYTERRVEITHLTTNFYERAPKNLRHSLNA